MRFRSRRLLALGELIRGNPGSNESGSRNPTPFPNRTWSHLTTLFQELDMLAIGALEDGPKRNGELTRRLVGISHKVLSQTLKRLEDHGLVTRTVYPEVSARVGYELTGLGHGATGPLVMLREWVETNGGGASTL